MDDGSSLLTPTQADGGTRRGLDALDGPKTRPTVDNRGMPDGLVKAGLDDSSCLTEPPPGPPIVVPLSDPATSVAVAASSLSSSPSSTTPPGSPAGQIQFRSHTIAPSPPLSRSPPVFSTPDATRSDFHAGDPTFRPQLTAFGPSTSLDDHRSTRAARASAHNSLRLQIDIQVSDSSTVSSTSRHLPDPLTANASTSPGATTTAVPGYIRPSTLVLQHKGSSAPLKPVSRTPSLKTAGHHGFGTASAASSTVPSPIISAMGDVTPLPSPLLSGDSPGPWKKLGRSPPGEIPFNLATGTSETALVTANGESLTAALAHHAKRKAYAELLAGNLGRPPDISRAQSDSRPTHTRDRSLSEYIPDPMQLPKRMVAVSAAHIKSVGGHDHVEVSYEAHMRREPHLSEARGLTPVEKPPTPPPSESSQLLSDATTSSEQGQSGLNQHENFEARGRDDHKHRQWRSIKLLGQGTFSRVMLATNQISLPADAAADGLPSALPKMAPRLHFDRRTLVAIKICEHGPKGGASEDRVEMSLKRELEIMRCIRHPSLVRLKAWNIEPTRAILVLSYCPGGDLFDVTSAHRDIITPNLLARMFSELVGAVQYLHDQHIVHRDIKLENVLVNLTPKELADSSINWATYPYSVTTLTDLGLSRRVADDEKLETRCGSDDYAAPEVIMGQPYDGRATDAWSLGVLLYALLEGRLPFDPNPGMSDAHRMRSRTSHRIARVEWRWIEFAGDDGEHGGDISKFHAKGLGGVMEIAEGLLKRARSRWTLDKVAGTSWIRDALVPEGGLRFREEAEGEEIL